MKRDEISDGRKFIDISTKVILIKAVFAIVLCVGLVLVVLHFT